MHNADFFDSLSHSLILHINDACWKEYFSCEEIQEIQQYQAIQLSPPTADIQEFFNELKDTPRDDLYNKINDKTYIVNSDQKWVQDCYNACFRLVESGFFPLQDVTEQGIGKRIWSCVDSCYDFSTVRCIR